jgi:hypothetical protein
LEGGVELVLELWAIYLLGVVIGVIANTVIRLYNTRNTAYGYMDVLSEAREDGEVSVYRAVLSEKDLENLPNRRRVVLKVRMENKDFNGNN